MKDSIARRCGAASRRLVARMLVAHSLDLHVSGLEQVPRDGPLILAARHYHHLFDAAAIMASLPREVHVVVALDWVPPGLPLRVMQQLTSAARWPAVWRRGRAWRLNRAGYRACLDVLRGGSVLLVFPEGRPAIDPHADAAHAPADRLLDFEPGFLTLAEAVGDVPVVPVGLAYAARASGGWHVWLRFGQAIRVPRDGRADRARRLRDVQATVRALSSVPYRSALVA